MLYFTRTAFYLILYTNILYCPQSEYTIDSSKHFRVPLLILRALRLSPENKTPKVSSLGNCFAWLLIISSTLLIIITTTSLIKEPLESLPEFMLRSVAPMRSILCLLKILVICKNRTKLNDDIKIALMKIPYPKVLEVEVKKFTMELQTSSNYITAFVIFTFLYNIPTVVWGICLVFQQNEFESTLIKLWLPIKTFFNKTVIGDMFCDLFELLICISYLHFHVIDIIQVAFILTSYLLTFVVFGFATLIITLAGMAVKMLRHLNHVLTTLHPENSVENWSEQNVRDVIKYAVQQHQRCIAFIASVNAMFSTTLLLDFWTFLFGLCSIAYHIVKVL